MSWAGRSCCCCWRWSGLPLRRAAVRWRPFLARIPLAHHMLGSVNVQHAARTSVLWCRTLFRRRLEKMCCPPFSPPQAIFFWGGPMRRTRLFFLGVRFAVRRSFLFWQVRPVYYSVSVRWEWARCRPTHYKRIKRACKTHILSVFTHKPRTWSQFFCFLGSRFAVWRLIYFFGKFVVPVYSSFSVGCKGSWCRPTVLYERVKGACESHSEYVFAQVPRVVSKKLASDGPPEEGSAVRAAPRAGSLSSVNPGGVRHNLDRRVTR